MTINLDNLRKWTEDLRTTTDYQVNGKLAKHLDDDVEQPVGYCCLGRGCLVAGIPMGANQSTVADCAMDDEDRDPDEVVDEEFYFGDNTEFPPPVFHEWLGRTPPGATDSEDVPLAWPLGHQSFVDREGAAYTFDASELNDTLHLSFSQIADVIDYIGVKP